MHLSELSLHQVLNKGICYRFKYKQIKLNILCTLKFAKQNQNLILGIKAEEPFLS